MGSGVRSAISVAEQIPSTRKRSVSSMVICSFGHLGWLWGSGERKVLGDTCKHQAQKPNAKALARLPESRFMSLTSQNLYLRKSREQCLIIRQKHIKGL